jgi:ankyrin repeat protein
MDTTIPPIVEAIWKRSTKEVRHLAAAEPSSVNDASPGLAPLHEAARTNAFKVGAVLLDHSADPNIRGIGGHTPLHDAALGGHVAFCRLLVGRGADINAYTHTDVTPLGMSLYSWADGAMKCTEFLRKSAAAEDLVSAIYSNNDGLIASLVGAKAPSERLRRQIARSIPDLFNAWRYEAQRKWQHGDDNLEILRQVVNKHLSILDLLVSQGAQLDSRGIVMPHTAAFDAVNDSNERGFLLRLLLQRGANPNARYEGQSLLEQARQVRNEHAIAVLQEFGAR